MVYEEIEILFAKTRDDAIIPTKRDEDAGYDIYAAFDEDSITIPPQETVPIPTGIASVIPIGYFMEIKERGSTGSRSMKRSAGIMDSGYRDEWLVFITNCGKYPIVISDKYSKEKVVRQDRVLYYPKSKAIAQAVIYKEIPAKIRTISQEELNSDKYKSERGKGRLGSSGK